MSNIYVQEPPCEGKVCLETSVGDIDIELWSKECPKACRNFIQLCLEGYYDRTKFFRVVPDFIVQGGDPTNTGTGGESIWGKPFKDEFHSRLRMVRRGLLAMANAGKDDNGSQFFFTLAATKELQNKHTIFGKVAGDTIYNMIRLGEGHIEDGDRPKYPHKIIKTRVLINPFPDIVPRLSITQELDKEDRRQTSRMKATKNFSLLSFGEEAEGDEEVTEKVVKDSRGKSKSAHDLAADPTLAQDIDTEIIRSSVDKGEKKEEEELEREISSIRSKLTKKDKKKGKKEEKEKNLDDDELDWDENPFEKERQKKKEELQKEFKALSKEMKGKKEKKRDVEVEKEEKEVVTEEEKKNDMLREYHEEQKKFRSNKKDKIPDKKSKREEQTLALLQKFKAKLSGIIVDEDGEDKKKDEDKEKEKDKDQMEEEDEDEILGDDWMKAPLKFEDEGLKLAKDANTKDDDWFDIYDPRNKLNKRRREKDAIEGMEKKRAEKMKKL
ncbi:peptidyl-prolyl cis-trans isomerase CWC27 homolog [Eurytemora carolleeae]|uniref:peptidyl-prolyl cis-trans isomerase CWC27 homolog n=1 Tax=Eurytemora carolleeae TaxID=1294199 RepID=UPI000C765C0A|nr:peptidyl-prolyl cis-trans isomerase CWC27 homolog [Eurytemora carolleeae]XP_023338707.1 peptidyl-prolyl cis-trans isomerase CWC27 homolog [Eurytemora carolleeae]|eukprot:XP_023338706.1 peptidyl-prolyl cis-trans isomerase CWC27 homolog [Eurytemora affinis]